VWLFTADSDGSFPPWDTAWDTTSVTGAFSFRGRPVGESVWLRAGWASPPPDEGGARLTLRAGINPVDLTMESRPSVRILLEDVPDEQESLRSLYEMMSGVRAAMLERRGDAWRPNWSLRRGEGGWVAHGLDATGEYAVWITSAGSRYAYARFAGNAGKVRVRWEEGGTVTVRLAPSERAGGCRVSLRDALGREVQAERRSGGGDVPFRGLPESTWSVRLEGPSLPVQGWTADRTVATGGSVEIRIPEHAAESDD
jgi:hypothetical protein